MNMRSIYRKVAKRHGVSVAEVRKDMQAAIDYAYQKSDKSESEKMMQKSIPRKEKIPTAEEFIKAVAHTIKNT